MKNSSLHVGLSLFAESDLRRQMAIVWRSGSFLLLRRAVDFSTIKCSTIYTRNVWNITQCLYCDWKENDPKSNTYLIHLQLNTNIIAKTACSAILKIRMRYSFLEVYELDLFSYCLNMFLNVFGIYKFV